MDHFDHKGHTAWTHGPIWSQSTFGIWKWLQKLNSAQKPVEVTRGQIEVKGPTDAGQVEDYNGTPPNLGRLHIHQVSLESDQLHNIA